MRGTEHGEHSRCVLGFGRRVYHMASELRTMTGGLCWGCSEATRRGDRQSSREQYSKNRSEPLVEGLAWIANSANPKKPVTQDQALLNATPASRKAYSPRRDHHLGRGASRQAHCAS